MASAVADNKLIEIHVADVVIGERHRKDMGDLESLAASIQKLGLLQPIGVTDSNTLVFGERRLRAVADVLLRPMITARVVSVCSILEAEHDENELCKSFTISERVAIAAALKAELGSRQGKRTDLETDSLPKNFQEVPKGKQTSEVVAEKAGFGNETTFRQAEKVVLKGHADLVAAMDSGDVAISTAAKLAELPKSEQKKAVAGGKQAVKEAVRLKREKSPSFNLNDALQKLGTSVRKIAAEFPPQYRKEVSQELHSLAEEFE